MWKYFFTPGAHVALQPTIITFKRDCKGLCCYNFNHQNATDIKYIVIQQLLIYTLGIKLCIQKHGPQKNSYDKNSFLFIHLTIYTTTLLYTRRNTR